VLHVALQSLRLRSKRGVVAKSQQANGVGLKAYGNNTMNFIPCALRLMPYATMLLESDC
jgi:hypothetical protein